jgi:hypothetical protein
MDSPELRTEALRASVKCGVSGNFNIASFSKNILIFRSFRKFYLVSDKGPSYVILSGTLTRGENKE